MKKNMICTACPQGCPLTIEIHADGYVLKTEGNKCPRGASYAKQEVENPMRTLTSIVVAEGLGISMIPVRTDKPIPKSKLFEAMEEIKKLRVTKPIKRGEPIVKNLLGLNVDLVSTRTIKN